MKITMTCECLGEQLMLFDLLDISDIPPERYKLINDASIKEPNEPVNREIEIEINIKDEFDRITISKILNFWTKHWDNWVDVEPSSNETK